KVELRRSLVERFRNKEYDKGLVEAVEYVRDTMRSNIGKQASNKPAVTTTRPAQTTPPPAQVQSHRTDSGHTGGIGMDNIGGWICIGLVALLAIWLVIGLVRSFTGAGRSYGGPGGGPGGGGYGGGYGPGYGGGGGGGFFSGLI